MATCIYLRGGRATGGLNLRSNMYIPAAALSDLPLQRFEGARFAYNSVIICLSVYWMDFPNSRDFQSVCILQVSSLCT